MTNDSIARFLIERSIERISIGILTQSDTQYQVKAENDSQSAARPLTRSNPLSLLPSIAPTVRSYFEFAPVPQRIALAPDRFYIWLIKDFERWNIPIQFTELEARSLLPLLERRRNRSGLRSQDC